ncbi:MAG: MBL fold metallo-hydrolase [Acidimicrobiia bacterium]
MELTVLGASGSYGSPTGGPCSGYLVRAGGTTIAIDCGNGILPNLQQHAVVEDLTAVVLTHIHPDHCVDLYGLYVLRRWGLELSGLPVYAPKGVAKTLGILVDGWDETFDWRTIGDGDAASVDEVKLRFSRTDHPPPTFAVEVAAEGKRLVYTSDTGTGWTARAFDPGADLVLSEATYQRDNKGVEWHLTAEEAGVGARDASARRLMITHLWPRIDPVVSLEEASAAFGAEVTLAAPHLTARV